MHRTPVLLRVLAAATFASVAGAQDTTSGRLTHLSASTVSLSGTSNLRSFSCRSSTVDARVAIDPDTASGPLVSANRAIRVAVTVPVKSLDCGPGVTRDMFNTLRGTDFPIITYRLGAYVLTNAGGPDSILATTTGTLTVSGKDTPVQMVVTGRRLADGRLSATGTLRVNMTDFGITPPRLFLGTLRVHDAITVHFDLSTDPALLDGLGLERGLPRSTRSTRRTQK